MYKMPANMYTLFRGAPFDSKCNMAISWLKNQCIGDDNRDQGYKDKMLFLTQLMKEYPNGSPELSNLIDNIVPRLTKGIPNIETGLKNAIDRAFGTILIGYLVGRFNSKSIEKANLRKKLNRLCDTCQNTRSSAQEIFDEFQKIYNNEGAFYAHKSATNI